MIDNFLLGHMMGKYLTEDNKETICLMVNQCLFRKVSSNFKIVWVRFFDDFFIVYILLEKETEKEKELIEYIFEDIDVQLIDFSLVHIHFKVITLLDLSEQNFDQSTDRLIFAKREN